MPYEGEFAQYRSLRRLAESEKVKQLLGAYKIRLATGATASLDKLQAAELPLSKWQPDWVLAVDGSHHEVQVKNGFPGAEASYLTIASVLLDVEKIRQLDQNRPVDPKVFRTTEQAESIDWAFPGSNVIAAGEQSAKDSLRKALFEVLGAKRMSEDSESLLETYEALLAHKPQNTREQRCPYEDCPIQDGEYVRGQGKYTCNCQLSQTLYATDALRIHEGMNPAGTNGKMFAEIMQVLERVWVVHILRTLEQKNWLSSLRKLAIVIDGPLAIFGHPAWLSQSISKELTRINALVKEATDGQELLLIGIEKTGEFVEHFKQLDTDEEGNSGQFPLNSIALLTDSYIKQNIIFSESPKPYGRDTYFGRKFFYKTSSGAQIVAMLPFLAEAHENLNTAELWQFPRLTDAIGLLNQLVSSRYPNALSPLVAANAEAAIPLNLGKKVLERLAKELISKS
ncbi:MAG: DNA double-strand break repair nuclease NurA [Acidobacteria bacterium]|nr:DNA double-strand break repair nuclease NurA [Acidobacteriota bacterium]MBI3421894.1 DNA double-strand break repair nuclease NurA [Acidobacteriota bacterium]